MSRTNLDRGHGKTPCSWPGFEQSSNKSRTKTTISLTGHGHGRRQSIPTLGGLWMTLGEQKTIVNGTPSKVLCVAPSFVLPASDLLFSTATGITPAWHDTGERDL